MHKGHSESHKTQKQPHMWNPRPCKNEGELDAASTAAIAKVPEPLAARLKTAPTEAPKPAQSSSGLISFVR